MKRDELIAQKNEEIFSSEEIQRVRRSEAAVNDEAWMRGLLKRGPFGTMATAAGEQPFLNTHTYVYDEARNCIYLHRDPVGRTSANLERNPRVCYQVVEMGRMYSGPKALDFGVEYRSVVIFGTARQVELDEAAHALRLLMEKYAPHLKFGEDYEPFKPACPQAAAVYRIDIERWSGKRNEVAADHPGAYDFLAPGGNLR
jgi:uncharacterized protein